MRTLRNGVFLAALIGVGLGISDAKAQQNWAGSYVGLNAGYAWGKTSVGSLSSCPSPIDSCYFGAVFSPANMAAIGGAGSGSQSSGGFAGGVQVGNNWQSGAVVFGVEADVGTFKFSAAQETRVLPPNPGTLTGLTSTVGTTVDTDWLVTLRGRLGWSVSSNLLVFVTGGGALTQMRVANSYSDNVLALGGTRNGSGGGSQSEAKIGWTIGGGGEMALNRNWSLKAEYLYLDFGTVTAKGTFAGQSRGPNSLDTSADLTAHIARVGINYKF